MAAGSWSEIEELFLRGLHASDTARRQLLADVHDSRVVAAVTQLWIDAAAAPSSFLGDRSVTNVPDAYRVGSVVEGRFRLERLLGSGGMGQVFAAIDTRLDRAVALKFLAPAMVRHPVMRSLLEREAQALCRLAGHPNICTVHDLYWDGETPFLVMELLAGETLAARLTRGALPIGDAVAVGLSIVEGLAHAHARDVIHRDVKPANIMLTPFGPKLFDFGIAKRIAPAGSGEVSLLAPLGTFVGSVSYTSPEQAEGLEIDARADVFSVGCVLYEMVTGLKAFDGATRLSVLSAVLRAEPTAIRTLNPSVPPDYARIVAKCLEKDASERYRNTLELRDALDRLARHGLATGSSETSLHLPSERPVRSAMVDPARTPMPTQVQQETRDGRGAVMPPTTAASGTPSDEPAIGANPLARGLLTRGHTHPICLMLSASYGLMVALALLVEVAYEWPSFGSWALPVAALTGVASIAVSSAAFAVLRERVSNHRPHTLPVTFGIFIVWSLVLSWAVIPQLPDRALVQATIKTMIATVGYPKSLLEAFTLPFLSIIPLQVVCALELQLQRGHAAKVHRILTSQHQTLALPGIVVVRPGAAAIVFATVTIWWLNANARLLESLQDGPFYGLFLQLGVLRVASGLLMLLVVLGWYTWRLNDLAQCSEEQGRLQGLSPLNTDEIASPR